MNKHDHLSQNNPETYWGKFLETGRIEDYLRYKREKRRVEEAEFAKIDEFNGEANDERKRVLRPRAKDE
ncbi:MAG TPA: hypothetical protein PKV63_06125 [Bacilli bacterium]|nr:hypothetical protein [Bacilli bacterium]